VAVDTSQKSHDEKSIRGCPRLTPKDISILADQGGSIVNVRPILTFEATNEEHSRIAGQPIERLASP
jgi:hypothetical protein